jgi:two-component system, OmpR family, sensor histidine kinase CreC
VSIRARIFFVFVATVVAGFALLAHWIRNDVADRYSESFEEVMVDMANLLAEVITTDINQGDYKLYRFGDAFKRVKQRSFAAQIYDFEKTSVDIRVYVTNGHGIVIYDSDNGKAVGEDYSDWRDVHLTLNGEYGARATRFPGIVSPDDPERELTVAYVAAPIYFKGKIAGVVTVAKPKNNIDRFVAHAREKLLWAVVLAVILVVAIALMLYSWVSRPLQSLVDYAHRISHDERVEVPSLGDNEIGRVGQAMEDMRQALEDKHYVERYVQTLTHELKSPLTAIQTAAELLGRELPADKREQFSNTILRETERLNEFSSQLLILATLEKRRHLEDPTSFSINQILADIINSHQLDVQNREQTLLLEGDEPCTLNGDPFLIRQAIDNLLRNAIEFSPNKGKITISLRQETGSLIIDIIDQGPGIPDYVGERIYERFYSLPRPDSGRKSTGIGLTFAREVAQLHGGTLTLENLEQGARARLTLLI